jgi:hypothetical protein
MKWLIGTACVVIIVSGAVYLNGQYQAYAARQAAENAHTTALALRITAEARKQKEEADEKAEREDDERHINAEDCAIYARQIIDAKKAQKEPDAVSMRRIGMCSMEHVIQPDDMRELHHFAVIDY